MSRIFAISVGAFAHLAPQLALACPGCKDSLTEQHVNAYGWSIVFMMSMPFLILGSLSAYFYYEVRKARRLTATQRGAREASATPAALSPSPLGRG